MSADIFGQEHLEIVVCIRCAKASWGVAVIRPWFFVVPEAARSLDQNILQMDPIFRAAAQPLVETYVSGGLVRESGGVLVKRLNIGEVFAACLSKLGAYFTISANFQRLADMSLHTIS